MIGKCVNHVVGTGRKACVRYGPLSSWWAHQDLNLGPKDSGLCCFHNSLDYAFTVFISELRWVPSSLYTFNSTFMLKLGSALAWIFLPLAFSEFDTIPYAVSTHKAQLSL